MDPRLLPACLRVDVGHERLPTRLARSHLPTSVGLGGASKEYLRKVRSHPLTVLGELQPETQWKRITFWVCLNSLELT